jgi:peptidoglycan/xylan/chitin deacetylase (PgdA/CDA1 family)
MNAVAFRCMLLCWLSTLLQCSHAGDVKIQAIGNREKEVVCFIYHRFGDSRYPTTNTPITDFANHLAYLQAEHYTVMNFSDAIRYLKDDSPVKKVAVITIDDGYKSFLKHGYPLLRRYKMPATLFINTKTVGGGDYMNWDDLKNCLQNKIEIGNHTHSHDFFLNLPEAKRYDVFRDEIAQSQSIIKNNLGVVPEVFTYPYGEFDLKMKQIVKDAGFIAAAAQNSGVIYAEGDLFQCPRFPMSEAYSAKDQFMEKVNMKALRVKDVSPESFMMTPDGKPVLRLLFEGAALQLGEMKCYVQGGKGVLKFIDRDETTITVQSVSSISSRRRTLYTITVKDKNGVWHWYSHLWINPRVKG